MIVRYTPISFVRVATRFILSRLSHNEHQSLAIMHQRTIYLLKHANSDPVIVASIHSLSLKSNLISHLPVHTSLVTAYARAGNVNSSLTLFEESTRSDVISWNSMISAGVLSSQYHVSISIFQEMMEKNVELDPTTLVVLLSAVSCALISMYSKCGDWCSSEFGACVLNHAIQGHYFMDFNHKWGPLR